MADHSYYSGVNPFVDLMKSAEPFFSGRPEHSEPSKRWRDGAPLSVSERGWVTRLQPGQVARSVVLSTSTDVPQPSGRVTVLYEGKGVLEYRGKVRDVQRKPGRDEFALGPGGLFLELTQVDGEDPMRNIRLYIDSVGGPGDGTFTRSFLESLKGFRVLRAMDWIETNRLFHTGEGDTQPPLVRQFSDYATRQDFPWHPVPFEVLAELANQTGADLWVNVPHAATDGFVRQMAKVVHDTLKPGLKVYVEYSNETWNTMFAQTVYAAAEGCRHFSEDPEGECTLAGTQGLCSDPSKGFNEACVRYGRFFHAMKTAQVGGVWASVFADRPGKLVRVLGAHTGEAPWWGKQMLDLEWDGKTPVHEQIDAYAIAPYFGGDLNGSAEHFFAMAPAGSRGFATPMPYALVGRPDEEETVYSLLAADVEALGAYPKVRLLAYEGGQHLVGHDAKQRKKVTAWNQDPRMKPLYLAYLRMWASLSDGELFVHYNSPGAWSDFGAWGSKRYPAQPLSEAPKHAALLEYMGK